MATGYVWTETPLSVDEYCAYWVRQIAETYELPRSDWDSYWSKLEADHIVKSPDKEAFDQEFTASQRQKVHPRPGLFCEYSWPLSDAARLDDRGLLVTNVRNRVNQLLSALRSPKVRGRMSED
jgi:hypothetical protein